MYNITVGIYEAIHSLIISMLSNNIKFKSTYIKELNANKINEIIITQCFRDALYDVKIEWDESLDVDFNIGINKLCDGYSVSLRMIDSAYIDKCIADEIKKQLSSGTTQFLFTVPKKVISKYSVIDAYQAHVSKLCEKVLKSIESECSNYDMVTVNNIPIKDNQYFIKINVY